MAPLAPLPPGEQKFRDQELRLLFARLIARGNFGEGNLIFGKRVYSNARVHVPRYEEGPLSRICAKVVIAPLNLFGPGEVDLSAQVSENREGIKLSMSKHADFLGSQCKGAFEPFPELEALSSREP